MFSVAPRFKEHNGKQYVLHDTFSDRDKAQAVKRKLKRRSKVDDAFVESEPVRSAFDERKVYHVYKR